MDSDAEDTKSLVENFELSTEVKSPQNQTTKKRKKKKRTPEVNARVKILPDNPEKLAPLVGYFPSGFDPHKIPDGGSEPRSSSTAFCVYRNKNMPKRLQVVVSPSGSNVDFVGTSYSGEAASGHRTMFALGVFDKATGALKIVPIAANKIFRLEPKVKGLESSSSELATPTKEEMTAEEKYTKRRNLSTLFASKDVIQRDKKFFELRKEPDAECREILDDKMKDIAINKSALEAADAHITLNIPPYNASATTPDQAYQLDKIILKGEWDYLLDIFNLSKQGEGVDFSAYSTFVRHRMFRVRDIQDDEEKRKLCGIFSFINHLIKFKDLNSMDGVSSTKHHRFPSILKNRFMSMFAVPDSKRLPPEKHDLLVAYVLVLTLFADEFRTDFSDITKDLKMSAITLRKHFLQLGCKMERQKGVAYATLPVPLQFPALKQKRQKRK